jgi:hypothetical protein
MHTIKTQKHPIPILKIDLSKSYDRVSWLHLRLLLLHIGIDLSVVKWIKCCVTIVSFVHLTNGSSSPFFQATRGLRQGFPLSPYLFLLVVDRFSQVILAT